MNWSYIMDRSKRLINKIGSFVIFMGPSLIAFSCVLLIPFLYGFYLTFTDYSPISITYDLVGLSNYKEVFSDKEFWGQFFKTLRYVFYSTVFCNLLAFILAYLLTSNIRGRNFLRGGFLHRI